VAYSPTDLTGNTKPWEDHPIGRYLPATKEQNVATGFADEDEDTDLLPDEDDEHGTVVFEDRDLFELDPTDPLEDVLISIVKMNRKKRADYAEDGDPWSNFRFTADVVGISPASAAIHNVAQKLARLKSLRVNGRDPLNENITDTYLDLAVYAVIALGIHTHPSGRVPR
jgi:hypothetical protein